MRLRTHVLSVATGLVLAGFVLPASAADWINVDKFSMRTDDDAVWSDPIPFGDVPALDSVVWLRASVELGPRHLEPGRPLGIYVAAIASHEIWWDGVRIGNGGVVGATPEEERPGPIQAHYLIADPLASIGTHELVVRTSAFHRHFTPHSGYWAVVVGDYDAIAGIGDGQVRIALISLSGIVMVAIFALMMFLQDLRDRSFLFLGLLCLTAATLLVAESWRSLFGYTYNWHLLRLGVVTGLSWLLDIFLLIFLARRFPMTGARWFIGVGIVAATVPILINQSWDPKAFVGFFWVFSLAVVWCARARLKRMRGSTLALLGLVCCLGLLFYQPGAFIDRNLYLSLDFLLVCLLGSHVLQVRHERQQREEALLKSARLEIELLKKHIQPHFLMNTLTALSEWIEEQPQLATKMIQSLSEEFRVLSDISNRHLIRMEEEIRLCRSHLEIMSQRKKREYRMTVEGVDVDAPIPPAVIHTLVENAITHNHYSAGEVEFSLREEREGEFRRYVFTSPLGEQSAPEGVGEGTGLRYVRARLQESFGARFELFSRAEGEQWRTDILVPAAG